MLRYIYLLCLIYFELVFCYSYIHGKGMRSRHRRREVASNHRSTTTSPVANIDVMNFIQNQEAEDYEPSNSENLRDSNVEYLGLEAPAPRRRRARHQLPAEDVQPRNTLHRQDATHLAYHPKRKCALAFPFFSHKNKTKQSPKKKKSHSLRLYKSKEPMYKPVVADKREQKKVKQEIQITESKIGTTMKGLSSNYKMKNGPKIHNSRFYFANPYRINNNDGIYGF